jgi:hypothetical protein
MGIFGDDQLGQISSDNPLGVVAPETMAEPGQPEEEAIDVVLGEQSPGQEIPLDERQHKIEHVKAKFKSDEELKNGITELQRKLGRENDDVVLNSVEEAIDYYIELEKELGRTSDIDRTRRENQRLQQELEGLRNTVNQLLLQQYNQPLRDPATGRFVSAREQVTQTPDIDISFDDIDPNDFIRELYEKGPNAESFKKILKTASEKIADAKIQQFIEKQKQEEEIKQQELLQKQNQARILKTHYDMQVNNLKMQYGEEEFNRLQPVMLDIFRKYPMYLNPQLFPNGFEIVFNQARNMDNSYQMQQQYNESQQQYNAAQKMAARISGSRPGQRFTRQPSQEEIEKQMIFGFEQNRGLWG